MPSDESGADRPTDAPDDADRPTDVVDDADLPTDVAADAERLTRLAREAVDDHEAAAHRERRDDLLADHGYTARVRGDEAGDVLVLHPATWVEDGRVRVERVDDTARALEIPLDAPGSADDWASLEAHNRDVARRVASEHGPVHGANAHAFADFMGNHYARPIEEATPGQVEEFLAEYFPRNAWPDDEQRAVVEESLRHVFATVDASAVLPERLDD